MSGGGDAPLTSPATSTLISAVDLNGDGDVDAPVDIEVVR
jgi:hypothetical protein